MRRIAVILAALLLASACNLSNKDLTPTVPSITISAPAVTPPVDTPTSLPGVTEVVAPTLTPFSNNSLPTNPVIAPPGVVSTSTTGESATIDSPLEGASVGGSPLMISGVAHNLAQDQFTLQVFDPTGQSLTPAQTIPLSNPNHVADVPWTASTSLASYTGPAQIRISDGNNVIGTVNVTIVAPTAQSSNSSGNSPNPQPTSGTALGTITSPTNGATLSGTSLTVTGTAGGFPGNQFTLLLLDSKETVLTSVVITLTNSAQNPVPWSGSLNTSGFKGYAEIRAVTTQNGQQTTIASVIVKLQ
ncbi:MAG TPA: hypothetical protein VHD90_17535 [Phototrophicaceae bacterium]|nr:hypothetical protein [Phototrophicaceae bacterium]